MLWTLKSATQRSFILFCCRAQKENRIKKAGYKKSACIFKILKFCLPFSKHFLQQRCRIAAHYFFNLIRCEALVFKRFGKCRVLRIA